jgi:5-methylcytosine-specific restriction protein A
MPVGFPTHRPAWLTSKQERDREYTRTRRDKEAARFYHSKAWLALTKIQLDDHPYCYDCLLKGIYTSAVLSHHVEPIDMRPELALDQHNLRSSCLPCHSRRHAPMRTQ